MSSFENVAINDRMRICVMTGSWSATLGHGYVAMRVNDWNGSLVAEAAVNVPARVSVKRTVQNIVSKVYSQLDYRGFNEMAFRYRIESKYPSRPTMAITEDVIKNSDPIGIGGIWTDTDNRYRLGIIPTSDGDYAAVVLESNSLLWHPGEIKAEIRSTVSASVFTCHLLHAR